MRIVERIWNIGFQCIFHVCMMGVLASYAAMSMRGKHSCGNHLARAMQTRNTQRSRRRR